MERLERPELMERLDRPELMELMDRLDRLPTWVLRLWV
jgi:hypothetical protein